MAGIIISSSLVWTAAGIVGPFNQANIVIFKYEFSIPLKRRLLEPNLPEGSQVTLIALLPESNTLTTTVNPRDIPLGVFKDFPFTPLVLATPLSERVYLIATYEDRSNSTEAPSQPVVVPGTQVTVKYDGFVTEPVKLKVEWIWKIKCEGRGKIGVQDDLFVPLKLDGDSYEGWETPVTLQIQFPNGDVYSTKTVEPKDILLGEFKDFTIPTPYGTELELTVTATQTGGPGTTLVVGDVHYEIIVLRN